MAKVANDTDMSAYAGDGEKADSGKVTADNAPPPVSIAMCTYNGEAHLREQLVSFSKQKQQPDELVACDDGSTDNTLGILEQFGKEAPFPVKVYRNQERLGPTKNFEKAISLCSGDFIFLSDQDDVWMPQKVNRLVEALNNNPGAGYVFSDALVVDEALRPMEYTMWRGMKFTPRERRRFRRDKQLDVLLKHNVVTGAMMAFRAELRNLIVPIPAESIHDEWIALLGSSVGMYGIPIEEPLIQYRQHSQQLLGGRKVSFVEHAREAALTRGRSFHFRLRQEEAKYSQVLERLALAGQLDTQVGHLLEGKIQHFRARQSIHKRPHYLRFFRVCRECLTLRYQRFSFGWKSA
ncbi:MAG: glycosyltransferase family 2 protein, partial [Dehalococcoidia bacterium]